MKKIFYRPLIYKDCTLYCLNNNWSTKERYFYNDFESLNFVPCFGRQY